jgi:hypothetical protein
MKSWLSNVIIVLSKNVHMLYKNVNVAIDLQKTKIEKTWGIFKQKGCHFWQSVFHELSNVYTHAPDSLSFEVTRLSRVNVEYLKNTHF